MDAQKKQTVSSIGHELRTLFALIMANIDIIEMESGKSEWIDDIREECKRSNDLIAQLMDRPLHDEDHGCNMTNQVSRITHFFRPIGRQKRITLHTDIQEGVRSSVDRSEIVQILSALMGNAVKYCDADGDIWVTLSGNDGSFKLAIENSFAGVKNLDIEGLFHQVHRDPDTIEVGTGYGIGLTIATKVAQEYGGSITAASNLDKKTVVLTLTL